jgi:hypothetical protein
VKIRQRHLIKEDARAAAGDPDHLRVRSVFDIR